MFFGEEVCELYCLLQVADVRVLRHGVPERVEHRGPWRSGVTMSPL